MIASSPDSHAVPHLRPLPGLAYPARNLFCIGRNYAEHARELGNEVPKEPVVFLKPTSSLAYDGQSILIPGRSSRVDHEVEIVVAIGRTLRRAHEREALAGIAGYAVGIDVTARDLQDQAKAKALPWAVAKGFDTFAVVGEFAPAERVTDPGALELELSVNGERRQKSSSAQMLFPIPALVAYLSGIFTLAPGDLIYTGTPAGVAPLIAGDRVEASLRAGAQSISTLHVNVTDEL